MPAGGVRDTGPITLPDFPPVPAYDLINRYIGYQPTPDIFASFNIDNLLNKYYVQYMNAEGQSQPSRRDHLPSPDITVKGELTTRFGVS